MTNGMANRPNELVRWYCTGRYHFDGHTLIWVGIPPRDTRGRPGRSMSSTWLRPGQRRSAHLATQHLVTKHQDFHILRS